MKIETYEVTELKADGTEDNLEESKQLIESLGLEGQKKLFDKDDTDYKAFPYRKMTNQEYNVYRLICPNKTQLDNFSGELIPLRVLQIAAHAKECDFVHQLQVWYPESADIKDPVLVGVKWDDESRIGSNYADRTYYILARWGAVLKPLNELVVDAANILKTQLKSQLVRAKVEAESDLQKVDSTVDAYLSGSDKYKPSVTFSGLS